MRIEIQPTDGRPSSSKKEALLQALIDAEIRTLRVITTHDPFILICQDEANAEALFTFETTNMLKTKGFVPLISDSKIGNIFIMKIRYLLKFQLSDHHTAAKVQEKGLCLSNRTREIHEHCVMHALLQIKKKTMFKLRVQYP